MSWCACLHGRGLKGEGAKGGWVAGSEFMSPWEGAKGGGAVNLCLHGRGLTGRGRRGWQ